MKFDLREKISEFFPNNPQLKFDQFVIVNAEQHKFKVINDLYILDPNRINENECPFIKLKEIIIHSDNEDEFILSFRDNVRLSSLRLDLIRSFYAFESNFSYSKSHESFVFTKSGNIDLYSVSHYDRDPFAIEYRFFENPSKKRFRIGGGRILPPEIDSLDKAYDYELLK